MDHVRIAAVRYLNTVPLIEGLEKFQSLSVTSAAPSHIAAMLRRSEADIGLASVIDAVDEPALTLLPVGMIGCEGPTLTVRVFSAVPLDRITRLHADTDSRTSVALARVILADRYGVRPTIVPFDARERIAMRAPGGSARFQVNLEPNLEDSWPETMLLIGDKVINDAPPADHYPYQLDLGEAWHEWTGLPFVYAVWMCRAGEEHQLRIRSAAALLDRQRRHNMTRLGWIVARRASEHRWPEDIAARYLVSLLRFSVGSRERDAVARFFDEAARFDVIANRRPAWADLSAQPAMV